MREISDRVGRYARPQNFLGNLIRRSAFVFLKKRYARGGTISSSIIYNKGAVTSENSWLRKFQGAVAGMVIVCFILLLLLIILLKV